MCGHVLYTFLADGGHLQTIADGFHIGLKATCTAVHTVAGAIVGVMYTTTVAFPDSEADRFHLRADLYAMHNMPAVAGE